MAMAALSPNSVLATPIQINPQAKSEIQTSLPQVAQDAVKTAKTAQTDTVTISAQALKMADDKNTAARESSDKADRQKALRLADNRKDAARNETQKNAEKAYTSTSTNQ